MEQHTDDKSDDRRGRNEEDMLMLEALSAPVDRLYWYRLIDLAAERPCIEMIEEQLDRREKATSDSVVPAGLVAAA